MDLKKTCHTSIYWKKRIEEIVTQYNLLSKTKMNFSVIENRIGNDFERAIKEYIEIQRIYIKFIKENYIEPTNEVNKKRKNIKRNVKKNHLTSKV